MNSAVPDQESTVRPHISARREEIEIIYTPSGVRRNGMAGWGIMVSDLVASQRLIWLLILRDISVRYRQSVLGYLWAVIPQIVTVGGFTPRKAAKH